ncbi:MgtC/SapB family protein [Patescibacteria group bacterium]|nr:MgtC/SapB family protein [Patescibacteria group bacterium]MBU4367473.1 MgtC/SapB family protein [Patescibacteria group bacterium]MBU4461793.1 MgtC/SapB family protein [Patescibacteria group bacterium]MCG2700177.1 MgtC/SapB family protein [Candidatus Parcubacteria bacterium]
MDFWFSSQMQIIFQLLLAAVLGGLVGLEREYQKRAAGLRTHSLVCLGSALFIIISLESFHQWANITGISFDPSRVISGIVLGVGFIGAGLIMHRGFKIEGLTTAAGIWVVAAIGVAVGLKLYLVAVFTSFLALGILSVLRLLEEKVFWEKEDEKSE